jgi:hypothetical protein
MSALRGSQVAFAASCILIGSSATAQRPPDSFVIHGKTFTCRNLDALDYALQVHYDGFFAGWDESDYHTAMTFGHACSPPQWTTSKQNRDLALQARYRASIEEPPPAPSSADPADANLASPGANPAQEAPGAPTPDAAAVAKENQRQRDQAAREMQESAKARAVENAKREQGAKLAVECRQSNPHLLFELQAHIARDIKHNEDAKKALAREQHIGEVSGYVNIVEEHEDGERIVKSEEDLAADMDRYRSLGGQGDAFEAVSAALIDPCAPKADSPSLPQR